MAEHKTSVGMPYERPDGSHGAAVSCTCGWSRDDFHRISGDEATRSAAAAARRHHNNRGGQLVSVAGAPPPDPGAAQQRRGDTTPARDLIMELFFVGLLAQVGAGVALGIGLSKDTAILVTVGAAAAWLGGLAVLAAVIAWAVRLGIRASRE